MNGPTSSFWFNHQLDHNQSQYIQQTHREWVRTPYGSRYRYDKRRGQSFKLMSYNILAQSLLKKHKELYAANVPQYLDWTHRLQCIRNEILEIKPAVLCLQEVKDSHISEIQNALWPMNYEKPLYKKRTASDYDDGCAIFYNAQYFELIDHHYVEYYQPDVNMLNRFNVAIIAKFASKQIKHLQFVVATTHLLYNPRRDDIRTAQLQILLAELDRMSVHTNTQEPLPIILTGDFNSLPFSTPYRLVHDGHIASKNLPLQLGIMDDCQHVNVTINENRQNTALYNSNKTVKNSNNDESDCVDGNSLTTEYVNKSGLPYNTGSLWHYLNFITTSLSNGVASTFQDKWVTVDYIFYTKWWRRTLGPIGTPPKFSSLQLLANYELPSIENCHNMGPIPNWIYGSDHYSTASEFVLLNR